MCHGKYRQRRPHQSGVGAEDNAGWRRIDDFGDGVKDHTYLLEYTVPAGLLYLVKTIVSRYDVDGIYFDAWLPFLFFWRERTVMLL